MDSRFRLKINNNHVFMGLQNDFNYEVAKRFLQQTQDIEYMRELSLNILEQAKSQQKLLEMWMGASSFHDLQDLESRRSGE